MALVDGVVPQTGSHQPREYLLQPRETSIQGIGTWTMAQAPMTMTIPARVGLVVHQMDP